VTVGLRMIALLAATAAAQAGAASPPSGLAGTWDVVRVEVDRADQMHWEVKPQDPELLYRELVIGKTETHFAADKQTCKEPAKRGGRGRIEAAKVDVRFLIGDKSRRCTAGFMGNTLDRLHG